ncbi:hypothetical protein FPOAC1_014108 [Fusarium poae]|nr:hypothetical protein FPOAC1_014108 [Fusarium poae]
MFGQYPNIETYPRVPPSVPFQPTPIQAPIFTKLNLPTLAQLEPIPRSTDLPRLTGSCLPCSAPSEHLESSWPTQLNPSRFYQVQPAYPEPPPARQTRQPELPCVSVPLPSSPRRVEVGEIEAKDGLPSADRNNKATLLLTGPFRTAKSSAKDLTPLVLKLQYANYHDALRAPWRNRLLRR